MKKTLISLLTILLIFTHISTVYAQEETVTTQDTATEQTEENIDTLSETLENGTQEKETTLTFGTILIATLTPALFIAICYMLIKFFKE